MLRELRVGGWTDLAGGASALIRPALLGCAMFLLMRAELMLGAAPLAVALLTAGTLCGENRAALAAGGLLGLLRLPLSEISPVPAIACALALAAGLLLPRLPRVGEIPLETRVSLIAGFSLLPPALWLSGGEPLLVLQAAACAALAATGAPFLAAALRLRRDRRLLSNEERAGLGLALAGMLAGLAALYAPAAEGAAVLAVLLLPLGGAATGVLGGAALALGGMPPMEIACLAVCALAVELPGWRDLRLRAPAAVAAMLGMKLLTGLTALIPTLIAAAVYLLLPAKLLRRIAALARPAQEPDCAPDRIAQEVSADVQRRLRALAAAFGAMAEGCLVPGEVPDEQELINRMRDGLCGGCAGYADCWNGSDNRAVRLLCQLITDALERMDAPPGMRVLFSDGEIPPDVLRVCRRGRMIPDRLGLMLRDFGERRRAELKRCADDRLLALQLNQAREILLDLAERQRRPVSFSGGRLLRVRAALDGAGLGGCVPTAFGLDGAEISLRREGGGWTREEVRSARAALSAVLGGDFRAMPHGAGLTLVQKPGLGLRRGISGRSGVEGQASGDSCMARMLDRSRMLLVLSDGMGSGEAAAEESRRTLELLWMMLSAGVSRPLAIECVNRQLLARGGEDMFATVDLCVVDLNTGVAEFTKLAACRSLILRGSEVLAVEGGHLPLGILERVQPAVSRFRLRPGDVIVMGSDGVMEAGDGLFIERLARTNAALSPEHLAERLVHEAAARRARTRADDMSCICAALYRTAAGGARENAPRRRAARPVPAESFAAGS